MISGLLIKIARFSLYLHAFDGIMTWAKLHIKRTPETPEVAFDETSSTLHITGRSLPEDAYAFYSILIDWAEQVQGPFSRETLQIHFDFDYFNSASGRYILEFLATLEKQLNGGAAQVIWLVDREDELMIEKGEEFASLLDIPLEIRFR